MNAAGEDITSWIGQSVERLEDPPLVTGRGEFAGDINFPHQLTCASCARPTPMAASCRSTPSAARALPGVFAVWTAADVADIPPIDFREGSIPALDPYRQPVLANGSVRYVGEPVAAVFADDPYVAEDAADLVTMEIDELPPVLDAQTPPFEFSPGHDSEPAIIRQGYGDVDAVFRTAPHVVELELAIGRHSGVPLETRGAIGRYDASRGILELHGAAKVPHRNQELLSRMLGIPPSAVHVHESHVGGGFGIRGEIYPEDVLVCVAAKRFKRPVKWIEDRREHLIAANHSRQQLHKIRAAVDDEGVILAIDDVYFHDQGAYVRTHATRVVHMTAGILPGPYRVPAYRSVGHFRLTNKTPAATYRAPGRYETTFVRERLVDAIAAKLGIDRIEVRRRNAITTAEMPYERPLEALGEQIHMDTGDYIGLLDKQFAKIDWKKLNAEVQKRKAAGELGRHRRRHVRRKERARSGRRREDFRRHLRHGRSRHRRRLARPGFRDRHGAGRRRRAWRRLQTLPRDPRPDRPHPLRHRRARLARHGDDGVGDAHRGAERAQEGARSRRRTSAGQPGRARHRRWRSRAQGSQAPALRSASAKSPTVWRRPRRRWAIAIRAFPRKAGSRSSIRSILMAATSPWCASMARPAA